MGAEMALNRTRPWAGPPHRGSRAGWLLLALCLAAANAGAAVLFQGDFESGTPYPFTTEAWHTDSVVIVKAPARSGTHAAKFTLSYDDPIVNGGKRAEVVKAHDAMNADFWYGFSLFVPDDWIRESWPEIIAQWHDVADPGERSRSPPLSLMIEGNTFRLEVRWDPVAIMTTNVVSPKGGVVTFWRGGLETGRWIDWVFHVRWSWQADGFIDAWMNGAQIVQRAGPDAYNDQSGPYFKMGLYKWLWNAGQYQVAKQRILYFDEFREADGAGTYAEVDPAQSGRGMENEPAPPRGLTEQ